MGWVYLAEQQRPRRNAAVKIIAPESGLPVALLESLRQEGDIAAHFQHPNLVTVFECGIIDGHYYLAMEHLPGGDLEARALTGLDESQAVEVIIAVAEALNHIHHKGFVHRDIKPSNVMFTDDGRAVLADFGIAKSIDSVGPMTKMGYSTGTPAYMSPEQVHGDPIDQRSDLYSLGIMFFQLLVGRLPFQHDNDFDMREAHIRQSPSPLPKSLKKFQSTIDRLLAKDPIDRYQHADEVIEHLKTIKLEKTQVGMQLTGKTSTAPRPRAREIEIKLPEYDHPRGMRVSAYFRQRKRRRLAWALLLVSVLLVYWFGSDRTVGTDSPAEETAAVNDPAAASPMPVEPAVGRSIAVLPFVNMSDEVSNDYFSDGIAEELLNALVRVPGLKVVGRTSSFVYKDRNQDLREIGRELSVSHLLEGSVRRSGDKVRITAQLIRVETGYHEWSETFDRELDDIFAVQEEISLAIVSRLGPELVPEDVRGLARPATSNVQAYDIYLRGRASLRNALSPEDYQQAIQYFDQALHKDPTFAEAEASKCLAYYGQFDETRDTTYIDVAVESCDRAVQMDDGKAEVHVALGQLYTATGRTNFAKVSFQRAIDLQHDNDAAHRGMGNAYAKAGDIEQAIPFFETSIELNPTYGRNYAHFAAALAGAQRFEEAAEQFQAAIRTEPDNYRHYTNLGGALFYLGRFQLAGAAFRRSIEYRPNGFAYNNAGTNFYYAGDFEASLEMFEKAVEAMPEDYRVRGGLGDACRWVTRCRDRASLHYEKALELANQHLKVNPREATASGMKALYLAHLGSPAEAEMAVSRALEIESANVDALWAAAVIHTMSGKFEAARGYVVQLEELGYPSVALQADPDLRAALNVATAN